MSEFVKYRIMKNRETGAWMVMQVVLVQGKYLSHDPIATYLRFDLARRCVIRLID